MADTISGNPTIQAILLASVVNSIDGGVLLPGAPAGLSLKPATAIAAGTAANQANKFWQSTGRTLSGATSENIDLYDFGSIDIGAGAGKDILGQALALTSIVALIIRNLSTSTGTLTIGGEGSTACWNSINGSDTVAFATIVPGGWAMFFAPTTAGYPVADATNHLLKLASSATLSYDIALLARG